MRASTRNAIMLAIVITMVYGSQGQVEQLKSYNVMLNQSTVSGLSAGAYMAVQMHIAFSDIFQGVGVFAGGPYNCANGSEETATTTCLTGLPVSPNPSQLYQTTESRSAANRIDPLSNVANDKVYVFSGTMDYTVYPRVVATLVAYYQKIIPTASNIVFENTLKASHTFPTDNPAAPNKCTVSSTPYISACDYDGAGIMLNHIIGPLKPRSSWSSSLNGSLITFDQTPFGAKTSGLANTGFVFVPASCQAGASCTVHLALHGCLQNAGKIGDKFATLAGYNLWAANNNMIVLYPQVLGTGQLGGNPDDCFDWWGYLGSEDKGNYDLRVGLQMTAIKNMMDALAK